MQINAYIGNTYIGIASLNSTLGCISNFVRILSFRVEKGDKFIHGKISGTEPSDFVERKLGA